MTHAAPVIFSAGAGIVEGDARLRHLTFAFGIGLLPPGTGDLVIRHNDEAVFVDERTGLVGPMSRMVVDGVGRRVLDDFYVGPPREPKWPIPFQT